MMKGDANGRDPVRIGNGSRVGAGYDLSADPRPRRGGPASRHHGAGETNFLQVVLFEPPDFLLVALEWGCLEMAGKVEIMISMCLDAGAAAPPEILDGLTDQTRAWIAGWQVQVDSGACWCTAATIGRKADGLITSDLLLHSAEPTKSWLGQPMPTRSQNVGPPVTILFARAIMGHRYAEWVDTLR